jgi:cytochrome P450
MLEELDAIVGRGNPVTWDHIRELRYCGAVFNETLRMYPPVGGDSRTAFKDDILPSGIRLEAGQRVSIPNAAIGRDPHLWEKPESFIPERWLQEGKPTRRPDEYILPVFWAGPRLCLGKVSL